MKPGRAAWISTRSRSSLTISRRCATGLHSAKAGAYAMCLSIAATESYTPKLLSRVAQALLDEEKPQEPAPSAP
jgi:hypothetical protein